MPVCPFCVSGRLDPDVLEATPDFWIVGDQYGVAYGHILIIPKEHHPCFGALPDALLPALEKLKERVGRFLETSLSRPFYFEHGVAGQTVPHAHLHAIPGPAVILPDLTAGRQVVNVSGWEQVREFHATFGPYLYFEQEGQAWAISGNAVPAGYVRKLAAAALGVPERADWRGVEPLDRHSLQRLWRDYWETTAGQP